jgi:large subunit ribosomal protein L9
MNIILLENIRNLGRLGDKVGVKPGYARNFLIPQGKAKFATEKNIAELEARRAEFEKRAQEKVDVAQKRAETLTGLRVTIKSKAGDEGKLYGSIGTREIAEAISALGNPVEKHEVRLPDGPIRNVGEYSITIELHTDVSTEVLLVIEAGKKL